MTSIKYMTSLLTFYLKGEIRTEKNFIQFKTPNTILGLIPLGAKTEKFTIDQISSTTTNFRLRLKYLIFGIFWLLIAVSCLSDSDTLAAGLICLLLGINNIIDFLCPAGGSYIDRVIVDGMHLLHVSGHAGPKSYRSSWEGPALSFFGAGGAS